MQVGRSREVKENGKRIELEVEEAANWTRRREEVRAIAEGTRCIRTRSVTKRNTK